MNAALPTHTPVVITVTGELDALASPALRERIAEALDDGARALVVDLSAVTFVDSSGLSVLIAGLKGARRLDAPFVLAGVGERIRLIFELTQADRVFSIFETVEDALAHLRS